MTTNDSVKPTAVNKAAQSTVLSKAPATKPELPMTTLKALCSELKLDPRIAREKLRLAARDMKKFPELFRTRKRGSVWVWPKGSVVEKEARTALSD